MTWRLCDKRWVNFNYLFQISVFPYELPSTFEIIAEDIQGENFPLFDKLFENKEEAQEFLDNFMINYEK